MYRHVHGAIILKYWPWVYLLIYLLNTYLVLVSLSRRLWWWKVETRDLWSR